MIANSHPHTPRRAGWAALAVLLFAAPGAASAQGLFSIFGGGGPSSYEIERELSASGYELTGPLILRGDVYVADVIVRGEGPERLIVDPQSGRIMQRFRTRGERWREAAAPPEAWADDPRGWTGPRPPADISPGGPPPDDWVPPAAPTVTGPVVIEPPKSAAKKYEVKPKPTPVANIANPPVIRSSPAPAAKPAAPPLVKPAASAAPVPSPSPSLQAAKADAPVKAPASAPTPAPAKTKSVNDIPVTPPD
jgi:hypothetical protein